MTAIFGERLTFGQERGPEVELRVWGDEYYARYETPEGYSAIYDDAQGVFTYARLEDGRFVSTGVSIAEPPPSGLTPHAEEADAVRATKAAGRRAAMHPPADGGAPPGGGD